MQKVDEIATGIARHIRVGQLDVVWEVRLTPDHVDRVTHVRVLQEAASQELAKAARVSAGM